MGAYLIDNPPAISQYRNRSRRPTGLVVLHTAEGVMDTVGPDTGAEATAEFIRRRTSYGSYHVICDSDSRITLVPFHLAAFQDGTGSNEYALAISFACKTSDWRRMSPEKRKGFLRQGALAFREMQVWLKANYGITTPLRLVSKAQSDAGAAGLIYHGHRDPARRTDPGISPPNLFPLAEFIAEIGSVLGGSAPAPSRPTQEEDDMRICLVKPSYTPYLLTGDNRYYQINDAYRDALVAAGVREVQITDAQHKELWSNRLTA